MFEEIRDSYVGLEEIVSLLTALLRYCCDDRFPSPRTGGGVDVDSKDATLYGVRDLGRGNLAGDPAHRLDEEDSIAAGRV